MKISNGFVQLPHSIFETDKLNLSEKTLLIFIMERANRFGKGDKEFNLSLNDFKALGIKRWVLEQHRQKLIDLNLITYKKGSSDKSSTYSLNIDNINNLTSSEEKEKPVEAKAEPIQGEQSIIEIDNTKKESDMGMCLGTIKEVEDRKRIKVSQYISKEAKQNYEAYTNPIEPSINEMYKQMQADIRVAAYRQPSYYDMEFRETSENDEDLVGDDWYNMHQPIHAVY